MWELLREPAIYVPLCIAVYAVIAALYQSRKELQTENARLEIQRDSLLAETEDLRRQLREARTTSSPKTW